MTVYFMRYFKRISLIILLALLSLILMNLYSLPDGKIVIKNMVVSKKDNINKYKMPDYSISFNQEINFSNLIINAIDKGIPLVFKVELRVAETNEIWPTKIIKKEIRYYQIEFKALREIYKTTDINGEIHEYQNILDAFEKLSKVEGFRFTAANNQNYELWLNISLDKKKLPKPLQVNYFDTTWNMSSEKKIHKLGKLN